MGSPWFPDKRGICDLTLGPQILELGLVGTHYPTNCSNLDHLQLRSVEY
jgi:hypothetical protein